MHPRPTDIQDVCALPPEDRSERLRWIRREILPHVKTEEKRGDGVRWTFACDADLEAKLSRWVALERACCGGLDWRLERRDDRLILDVRGVSDALLALLRAVEGA